MSSLPQHQLSAFRRYEHLIAEAVTAHPNLSRFTREQRTHLNLPSSVYSCAARCRDAINALLLNADKTEWTQVVDVKKLQSIRPDFSVGIKDKELLLGPKKAIRDYSSIKSDIAQKTGKLEESQEQAQTDAVSIKDGKLLNLQTLCVLMSRGELKHPYAVGRLEDNMIEPLETKYNVAIVWDEKRQEHVLIL